MSTDRATFPKWYVGYDRPTLTWQVAERTQVRDFQVFATFTTEAEARAYHAKKVHG